MNATRNAWPRWLALALALVALPIQAEPEVLKRPNAGVEASWETLKFEEIDSKPDTLAGYGIRDTFGGEVAIVKTFVWIGDTSTIQSGSTGTIWWPNKGSVRGMECDVMSAPLGGDIVMDLLVGEPLVSVYPSEGNPKILNGTTTTLTHTPEALAEQVPIEKRDRMQVKVVSAPDPNYGATAATVGELPTSPYPGYRFFVVSDGHIWEGRNYGAAWVDQGLAGGLTGVVATTSALPAGAAVGAKYLVSDVVRIYTQSTLLNFVYSNALFTLANLGQIAGLTGAVALITELPPAAPLGSVYWVQENGNLYTQSEEVGFVATGVMVDAAAAGQIAGLTGAVAEVGQLPTNAAEGARYLVVSESNVYTNTASVAYVDSGDPIAAGIWGDAWVANAAALPLAQPPATLVLTLDTGHGWRNDYPIWIDTGLPASSGQGLRCNVYVYNLPNDD